MMVLSEAALQGFRVLDLADGKGLPCTRLLADMGADVIKVEPPQGDPTRRLPPFAGDDPHPEKSLYLLHYNANKRGITLNLESADGQELFKRLAQRADVVIETFAPGYLSSLGLGYPELSAMNPRIIVTSTTPFGQSGPWRDYRADDLVAFAMGGLMALSGEPGGRPCMAAGELAYGMAAIYATWGTLVALYHRIRTGQGQHVDVSLHECSAHIGGYAIPLYSAEGRKAVRTTRAHRTFELHDVYPCKDGYARLFVLPRDHWRALREWIGNPPELMDPILEDQQIRRENSDLIDPYVTELTKSMTKEELYQEGQRRHLAISPVYTPKEFVESAQTVARELFVPLEHPVVGCYRHLGPVHKFSETPVQMRRPAPLLGEHNREIYEEELGLSPEDLASLRAAGVI